MNKFYKLVVFIVVTTIMSFNVYADWYTFETPKFKVVFPKSPTHTTKILNSEVGELSMHLYMYNASIDETDENLIYSVGSSEYPKQHIDAHIKQYNLSAFFKNSIDGMVKNVSGKLLSESKINLENYPGREFKIDFKDGLAIIKTRIYLVDTTVYFIQTITKTEKENNKLIDKFMNSFTIKK